MLAAAVALGLVAIALMVAVMVILDKLYSPACTVAGVWNGTCEPTPAWLGRSVVAAIVAVTLLDVLVRIADAIAEIKGWWQRPYRSGPRR